MNSRMREEMLEDAADNFKRINWMNHNLEGCDWCCGGGDEEMEQLRDELTAISKHLGMSMDALEDLVDGEIE